MRTDVRNGSQSFFPVRLEEHCCLHISQPGIDSEKAPFCYTTQMEPKEVVELALANIHLERLQPSQQAIDIAHQLANRDTTIDQAIQQLVSIHGRHP